MAILEASVMSSTEQSVGTEPTSDIRAMKADAAAFDNCASRFGIEPLSGRECPTGNVWYNGDRMRRTRTTICLFSMWLLATFAGTLPACLASVPASSADASVALHCAMTGKSHCCCPTEQTKGQGDNKAALRQQADHSCGCAVKPLPAAPDDRSPYAVAPAVSVVALAPPSIPLAPAPVLRRVTSPNVGALAPPAFRSVPHAPDQGRAPPF